MKRIFLLSAVLSVLTPLIGAELEIGNAAGKDKTMGFGILAEYTNGNVGKISITRKTKSGQENKGPQWGDLCSLRVYSPSGKLVTYENLGGQKYSSKKFDVNVPKGEPGVWRFAVSGGLPNDVFTINFQEKGVWGVRGELLLKARSKFPDAMYLFIPDQSDLMILVGSKIKWSIDGRELEGKPAKTSSGDRLLAFRPTGKNMLKMELPPSAKRNVTIGIDGIPGLMCPTPEAALKLKGGLVAVDGRAVEGKTQAEAYRIIQGFHPSDLAVPETFLKQKTQAGMLSSQNIDKKSPAYGQSRSFRKMLNFLNRQDCGIVPGAYAALAAIDTPATHDVYRNKGMINRAALSFLAEVVNMDASGSVRAGDLRVGNKKLSFGTSPDSFYGLARSYYLLKPLLPKQIEPVFRAAACEIGDKMAGQPSGSSFEWTSVMNGFCYLWLATGEERYKKILETELTVFLNNGAGSSAGIHPDGYYMNEFGPDGSFDNLSAYYFEMLYFIYGKHPKANKNLVERMESAIKKNMAFKTFFLLPSAQSGVPAELLAFSNNHSTSGSFLNDNLFAIALAAKEFNSAAGIVQKKKQYGITEKFVDGEAALILKKQKQTAKPGVIPVELQSGLWPMTGHVAWKNSNGFYSMSFFGITGNDNDGIMGPLFLWHKKTGPIVTSLRNKNVGFLKAASVEDVTWASVTGEWNGGLVVLDPILKKTIVWDIPEKLFTVSGEIRSKGKPTGKYIKWQTDILDKTRVNMQIQFNFPDVKNPVVNIPFYLNNGNNTGSITKQGVFTLKTPNGTAVCEYPANANASVVEKTSADVMLLRIAIPQNGTLDLHFFVQ